MKKWMICVLAAVSAAGLFAGCGKKEEITELAQLKTEDYVTLGQYTGLRISETEPVVTEEDLQEEIYNQLKGRVEPAEVSDRAVRKWDTATIDYVGKEDGVAFEGGTGGDYPLVIGSGSFIPGFEEGLIGAESGETRDLELTFPDNYRPEMAGKTVVFTVTVKKIEEYPLTDETAGQVSPETPTVQEFRRLLYDNLYVRAVQTFEQSVQMQLIGEIAAGCEWKKEVPDTLVQSYLVRMKNNMTRIAELYNTSLEQFLYTMEGIEESQFEENFEPDARNAVKEDMILQAIANVQNLNPTEEEVEVLRREEMENGGYESIEAYKEAVGEQYYNTTLKEYLMADKVTAYLMKNNEIEKRASGLEPAVAEDIPADREETETPDGTGADAEETEGVQPAEQEDASAEAGGTKAEKETAEE